MPKIRPGMRKPPADFSKIAPTLDIMEQQMKDVVCAAPDKAKSKKETTWDVAKLNHTRTLYVFDACFRERLISEKCLDYCCEMGFVDGALVQRWKISGYQSLCCVACITPGNFSGGVTSCVCRVPGRRGGPCSHCGCRGCAAGSKARTKAGDDGEAGDDATPVPSTHPPDVVVSDVVS